MVTEQCTHRQEANGGASCLEARGILCTNHVQYPTRPGAAQGQHVAKLAPANADCLQTTPTLQASDMYVFVARTSGINELFLKC